MTVLGRLDGLESGEVLAVDSFDLERGRDMDRSRCPLRRSDHERNETRAEQPVDARYIGSEARVYDAGVQAVGALQEPRWQMRQRGAVSAMSLAA